MTVPFGPQLIGETEKTLNALLRRFLADAGLTEPQWVTLRVAQTYGAHDHDGLVSAVSDRAHFPDARELVAGLTERGLLDDGRLTDEGRKTIDDGPATSGRVTGPIWRHLPAGDVDATTRVLNDVLTR